jgi:hypothetical protein
MPKPSRQDMYSVSVVVQDIGDTGIWDKCDGGEVDSSEKKYKPGAMAKELSLGGLQSVGNLTISRYYDLDRDGAIKKRLMNGAGKKEVVVTKQPLDVNGVPYGEPDVYAGTLKMVKPPEPDSEGTDEARIEIEVSSAGVVA